MHYNGRSTAEFSSWRKYSFIPILSERPKSATLITKFASILEFKRGRGRGMERERERERVKE